MSTDLFWEPDPDRQTGWAAAGALAVEMECAAVFAVAQRHDVAAACLLTVTDLLAGGGRVRIDADALTAAEKRLGGVAAAALA